MASQQGSTSPSKRRRANRSSDEEVAYAGPAELITGIKLPTPETTPSPNVSKRRRRRLWGSEEDFRPHTNGEIEINQYRVGGPRPLCRLPVHVGVVMYNTNAAKIWKNWLREAVQATLKKNDVKFDDTVLMTRRWIFEEEASPESPITILVAAKRNSLRTSWPTACLEIRSLCKARGLDDWIVEIVDGENAEPPNCYAITKKDPFVLAWPAVKHPVLGVLRGTGAIEVQVLRRGKDPKPENNPIAVIVTTNENSTTDWRQVREQIVNILDAHDFEDIAVAIGAGRMWRSTSESNLYHGRLFEEYWRGPAKPGGSIGSMFTGHSSTLGGFLEIQNPENDRWSVLGVTCYHSIVPEIGGKELWISQKTLLEWQNKGVDVGNREAEKFQVSQPSLADHQETMNSMEEAISERKDTLYVKVERQTKNNEYVLPPDQVAFDRTNKLNKDQEAFMQSAKDFFAKGKEVLGFFWAGSGLRRSAQLCTLDWALIHVKPERISENSLPDLAHLSPRIADYFNPGENIITRTAAPVPGERLFKLGRSTGFTMAPCNEIRACAVDDVSYEDYDIGYPVASSRPQFSTLGDSGAWVVNRNGHLVGMVVGGNTVTKTTRITGVQELFEDIRRITGAKAIRLPASTAQG
ncbi:MAG: hypothetical protein M1833_001824 [Piccolia ochrophora]|nr:MAG: hypothetical protein M1833_001824 [Piccolia ochrophora]